MVGCFIPFCLVVFLQTKTASTSFLCLSVLAAVDMLFDGQEDDAHCGPPAAMTSSGATASRLCRYFHPSQVASKTRSSLAQLRASYKSKKMTFIPSQGSSTGGFFGSGSGAVSSVVCAATLVAVMSRKASPVMQQAPSSQQRNTPDVNHSVASTETCEDSKAHGARLLAAAGPPTCRTSRHMLGSVLSMLRTIDAMHDKILQWTEPELGAAVSETQRTAAQLSSVALLFSGPH